MNIHLVLFNTKSVYGIDNFYDESIQILIESFKNNGVDHVHRYYEDTLPCDEDLKQYFETYKNNGYGFYAFKPLIILDVMNKIDDGDVVIYHDAGRPEYKFEVKNNIRPLISIIKNHYQGIGLCEGPWSHNQYTKDKCFKLMDCDTPYIRQKTQLAANWGIFEKNPKSLLFLNDWKKWCLTHEVVCTEEPDEINHDGFTAHRWDQSILTNLFHTYSLKSLPAVIHGWEKDINNYIGNYSNIKVANTFTTKEGQTLITDVFYQNDKLIVLATGFVRNVMLLQDNTVVLPNTSILDAHRNNHYFQFNIEYQPFYKFHLNGEEIEIDDSDIKFIIKKDYYLTNNEEHILSAICHTNINSLKSITDFVKYHLNLGINKIILHENGGNNFILLYNTLRNYIENGQVLLICWKNIPFWQEVFSQSNPGHITNVGETSHMNHSLRIYKTSKYLSCFNLDEYIVPPKHIININQYIDKIKEQNNISDKGGISILANDFGPPENGEPFYKSTYQVANTNQYNLFIFPKIIHFLDNVDTITCHSVTIGQQPFLVDKNILSYNHYPFIDNNRSLGESIGKLDNINHNLFIDSSDNTSKEVVIALYDRDISWIDKLNSNVKVTIYRKGTLRSHPNEIFLSNNVGRDVHTFFYHIVNNYNNLSDYTFFSQDYPFDHIQNYVDLINGKINHWNTISNHHFEGYWGFNYAEIMWPLQPAAHFEGMINIDDIKGRPHHWEDLPIEEYWNELFDHPVPDHVEYTPGGHFGISKEQIQMRSLAFYQKILYYLENEFLSPWIVERLEPYMFNSTIKTKI
jgi:hypothetical protein